MERVIKCGIKTCIHNNENLECTKKDLDFNYFDDYSIFDGQKLPDGTLMTTHINNTVGHFMGLRCRDFKMDFNKV